MSNVTKEELKNLINEKDNIENQLKQLKQDLETTGVGLTGDLVDHQGFPRADLDLPAIREQRNKIARLRTEHDEIMKQIEKGLHSFHQSNKPSFQEQKTQSKTNNEIPSTTKTEETNRQPFLSIEEVSPGSPAEESGLKPNDRILKFGTITSDNPYGLSAVAEVVKNSVGRSIEIQVQREQDQKRTLRLIPHSWSGRGVLGCRLVPFKN
eukprot:gb/GECH01000125.1/.p1 GENE.gb/GECH01000125.1/~~gb/GECH01000125.1/.p1  ORF type:complete len:209 (+),score=67.22 gb/GECH01000125.1/:1-627(+)